MTEEYREKSPEAMEPEVGARHQETKEVNPVFEHYTKEIARQGYMMMEEIHDNRDVFHISEHPRSMERRAETIGTALGASPEEMLLTKDAIAFHDTIIEVDEADPGSVVAMIKRHRGARVGDKLFGYEGNESKSADELIVRMEKANAQSKEDTGKEIFTQEQMDNVRWAIDATYPDVLMLRFEDYHEEINGKQYDYYAIAREQNHELAVLLDELKEQGITKGALFYQPHLENSLSKGEKVPVEVLMTALPDLGAAGMAPTEEFAGEGDKEMRELLGNLRKPEIWDRVANGDEEADIADRVNASTFFCGWLESQTSFATWQALRFEKIAYLLKETQMLPDDYVDGLRNLFSNYIKNIRGVRDRAHEVKSKYEEIKTGHGEKEAFQYIARTMHYEI